MSEPTNEPIVLRHQLEKAQRELAQARKELDEWRIALHSLTAQGSEFARDSKACVEYVRRARQSQHEQILKTHKELETLRQSLADALKRPTLEELRTWPCCCIEYETGIWHRVPMQGQAWTRVEGKCPRCQRIEE